MSDNRILTNLDDPLKAADCISQGGEACKGDLRRERKNLFPEFPEADEVLNDIEEKLIRLKAALSDSFKSEVNKPPSDFVADQKFAADFIDKIENTQPITPAEAEQMEDLIKGHSQSLYSLPDDQRESLQAFQALSDLRGKAIDAYGKLEKDPGAYGLQAKQDAAQPWFGEGEAVNYTFTSKTQTVTPS